MDGNDHLHHHRFLRVRPAVDDDQPGGLRAIAWCTCGWRSRAALTARLATRDLDRHLSEATSDAA